MSKGIIDIIYGLVYCFNVSRKPFTLRIESAERSALQNLSVLEGRPINQLLNEAIKSYLSQRGQKERDLEATLAGLRKYREQKDTIKRAIVAVVEAEMTQADPLEGELMEGQISGGRFEPAGPVQNKIRRLLGA